MYERYFLQIESGEKIDCQILGYIMKICNDNEWSYINACHKLKNEQLHSGQDYEYAWKIYGLDLIEAKILGMKI